MPVPSAATPVKMAHMAASDQVRAQRVDALGSDTGQIGLAL